MFLFCVLSFFKKGDTIQGGTLFKEILINFEAALFVSLVITVLTVCIYLESDTLAYSLALVI